MPKGKFITQNIYVGNPKSLNQWSKHLPMKLEKEEQVKL